MGCGSSKDTTSSTNNSKPETTTTDNKETAPATNEARNNTEQPQPTSNEGAAEPSGDFTDEQQQALAKHNEQRALHGCPAMTLDAELCNMAQKYAEHLAEVGKFEHSAKDDRNLNGQYVGENLSWGSGYSGGHGVRASKSWYDEIKDYDWGNHGFAMNTGHFTQVVWKESTRLGIGVAADSKGAVTVVGRYLPGGNMQGNFDPNVPPLL